MKVYTRLVILEELNPYLESDLLEMTILRAEGEKEEYLHVSLWKNGKNSTLYIHQCVAKIFIPNPNNLPCVNYKDENKKNNKINNLEWCNHQYNSNYGTRNYRIGINQVNHPAKSLPVLQFDMDGTLIAEYPSITEAHKQTGFSINAIRVLCNGGYVDNKTGKFYKSNQLKGFILFLSIKDGN